MYLLCWIEKRDVYKQQHIFSILFLYHRLFYDQNGWLYNIFRLFLDEFIMCCPSFSCINHIRVFRTLFSFPKTFFCCFDFQFQEFFCMRQGNTVHREAILLMQYTGRCVGQQSRLSRGWFILQFYLKEGDKVCL